MLFTIVDALDDEHKVNKAELENLLTDTLVKTLRYNNISIFDENGLEITGDDVLCTVFIKEDK